MEVTCNLYSMCNWISGFFWTKLKAIISSPPGFVYGVRLNVAIHSKQQHEFGLKVELLRSFQQVKSYQARPSVNCICYDELGLNPAQ